MMKSKKRCWLTGLSLAALCFMVFAAADIWYRAEKRAACREKTETVQKIMDREKEWIRENQGAGGEIYMNLSGGAGDVNPYFACQAAMGLLAGQPSAEDLSCAAEYLSWHAEKLAECEGVVTNYRNDGNGLEPTGEFDSVDSYIAVYLTLLSEYEEKGGRLSEAGDWQEALAVCAEKLEELNPGGLTQVSEKNQVSYLMDNAEVWEGCHRIRLLLESEDVEVAGWAGAAETGRRYGLLEEGIWQSVSGKLWNAEEQRFEIGLDGRGRPLDFTGWQEFYPDAIAQVYPSACGMILSRKRTVELYEKLCSRYEWESLGLGGTFDWPVLACIAVELGDEERAESFVKAYEAAYGENREYPLHTADAGWTARACEALKDSYEETAGRGILADILN